MEGIRLVEEAMAAGLAFRGAVVSTVLARTARGAELRGELERRDVPVEEVSERTFAQLADTETPQGIIAVVQSRKWTAADLAPETNGALLVIDGVQDPGNVGTLIRTAHALGAAGTIVLRGTADVHSPKTMRSAMGASFRHPV
ncbi:MAG TPA: RNA methyltransferase substrate-binding domain-containing protein, partial [Methylomirabilota bacterium]|nr:RNA methyltransferase substrate-binding domain-containing protein [Methylomirabilota bacterium]